MDYNYHTHTKRCGHVRGSVEDYIKKAIDGGIKYMGFSEHMPFKGPGGFESNYRMPERLAHDYGYKIKELKKKYKGKIDIKLGFEMEYYPNSFKYMLGKAIEYGAEYLILGQHFLDEEYLGGNYSGTKFYKREDLEKYVSRVCEGMKTGVFTYVAHPDVFNYLGDKDEYCEEMRKICVLSKKLNVPLEINFLGIRYKRHYPVNEFWKIAGEEGSPVTFGCDAHDVLGAYHKESLEKAKKLVKKYNLNYIGRPKLKRIKHKIF